MYQSSILLSFVVEKIGVYIYIYIYYLVILLNKYTNCLVGCLWRGQGSLFNKLEAWTQAIQRAHKLVMNYIYMYGRRARTGHGPTRAYKALSGVGPYGGEEGPRHIGPRRAYVARAVVSTVI